MKRRPSALLAATAIALLACGPPPGGATQAMPPIAPPAPAASRAALDAGVIETDGGVEGAPDAGAAPGPEPSPPPRLASGEIAMMRDLLRASHVVRGRVTADGDKRWRQGGVTVTAPFAVIEILEYIEGDPAKVLAPHRKGFALFGIPVPLDTHKFPSGDHVNPLDSLIGMKGQERIFLVGLPRDGHTASVSWGPPPDLRARFGEHVVDLVTHLPIESLETVRDARKNVERERAWSAENARRTVAHDRFLTRARAAAVAGPIDGAAIDLLAEAAATDVVDDLSRALGKPIGRSPAQRTETGPSVGHKYDLRVDGEPALDSTLQIRHVTSTGALSSVRVSAPLAKRLSNGAAPPRQEIVAQVKARYAVRFEGGLVDETVGHPSRGDGLEYVDVVFRTASRLSERGGSTRRLRFALTQPGLALFEYDDDWAAAP